MTSAAHVARVVMHVMAQVAQRVTAHQHAAHAVLLA
jgi:hypothetical protein